MKNLANLEKALVIAKLNTDLNGQKPFVMFYIAIQQGNELDAIPIWNMEYPNLPEGKLDTCAASASKLNVADIWVFVTSVNELQSEYLNSLGLEYRFQKDDDALVRLAEKLDMDRMHVGYDGEDEEGSYFITYRVDCHKILPAGLFLYDLRESDEDDSQPCCIEEHVRVNHYGCMLTNRALPVPMELEVDPVEYDEEGNIISQ